MDQSNQLSPSLARQHGQGWGSLQLSGNDWLLGCRHLFNISQWPPVGSAGKSSVNSFRNQFRHTRGTKTSPSEGMSHPPRINRLEAWMKMTSIMRLLTKVYSALVSLWINCFRGPNWWHTESESFLILFWSSHVSLSLVITTTTIELAAA
jgi:hypothetical protein